MNDVYCFARVVRYASFSRAADDFGISTSAVSRRISRLERAVGATLLLRSSHAVRLTSEGRAYFERIRSALEMIEGNEASDAAPPVESDASRPTPDVIEDAFLELARLHPDVTIAMDETERRIALLTPHVILTLSCHPERQGSLGSLARRLARPVSRLEPGLS